MRFHRIIPAAIAAVALAVTGCGSSSNTPQPQATKAKTEASKSALPVYLGEIDAPSQTAHSTATITGLVKPSNARITVDDKPVAVDSMGHFSTTVELHRGRNSFEIYGYANGHHDNYASVTVTKTQTQAEIVAARKARAAKRAAARARHAQYVADFKANAVTLDFDQLNKNPDRYAGKHVKYTGQIFQIEEDDILNENWMLLSVTNEGYDFWTDEVYVNYNRHIKSAEDDIVTIYGTVKGAKSYDTQIGGSNTVPEIDAKYIEE